MNYISHYAVWHNAVCNQADALSRIGNEMFRLRSGVEIIVTKSFAKGAEYLLEPTRRSGVVLRGHYNKE